MAYPSKFRDPYITSIRVEKKARVIAKSLGIELSDALKVGLNVMIKTEISNNNPKITPAILEEFLELEKQDIKDLQAYIHLKKEEQVTLENILEMQKEAEKTEEMIEVWDRGDEAYIHIPKSQYNPAWHILKEARA